MVTLNLNLGHSSSLFYLFTNNIDYAYENMAGITNGVLLLNTSFTR